MAKKKPVKKPVKKTTKKKTTNAVPAKGTKQPASPLAKKLASGKPTNQDQPEAKKKAKPFAKKGAAKEGAVAKKATGKKPAAKKKVPAKKKPAPRKKGKK